jgi:hypothetical protein
MGRKGATEDKFDDLIARMPRNMAGLIAFLVHNEARLKRDAETRELAIGFKASEDASLGGNPPASLDALKTSITQFAAVATSPAVAAAGPALQVLAHEIQTAAAYLSDLATKNPKTAEAVSAGAIAGAGGLGLWLTKKLFGMAGRFFGGGGPAGDAAPVMAAAEEGAGLLGTFARSIFGAVTLPSALLSADDSRTPQAKANDQAALDWIRSWFTGGAATGYGAPLQLPGAVARMPAGAVMPNTGTWGYPTVPLDPEAARERSRGFALGGLPGGGAITVSGAASVEQTLKIDISLDAGLHAALDYLRNFAFSAPLDGSAPTGTQDTDAAPQRGIGHQ